jgi:hypothetical protein
MKRSTEFTVGFTFSTNSSNISLSANYANYVAVAFVAPAEQVSAFRLPITSVSQTINAGDIRARICPSDSSNNFLPDTSTVLASATNENAISSGGSFASFTSFSSHTLTIGERYWIVVDNGSSNATVTVTPFESTSQSGSSLVAHALATFSGGTLAYNGTARRLGEQIEFSNGDIVHAGLLPASVTDGMFVFGSRMSGVRVSIGDVGLRVAGVCWLGARAGTGCTIATRVLDLSGNILGTSHTLVGAQQSGGAIRPWYFSEPVELQPNSTYRIVLSNPNGDGSSSNYFRLTSRIRAYSSGSVALLHAGIFQSIQTSEYDGTSWSDDSNNVLPRVFLLVLDADQPFITSGRGGAQPIPLPMPLVQTFM